VTASATEPDIVGQGRRLVTEAAARGLPVRLIGGVAFWLVAGERARQLFGRDYPDLDMIAHKRGSRALRTVLEGLGYRPERTFNAMHGASRLLYRSADDMYQLDIFLDEFVMCHKLDLGDRLAVSELTVPTAELLLTKLQIHQLNRKDIGDILMLLADHEVAGSDAPSLVNADRIQELCSGDWGLYTTVTDNLEAVEKRIPAMITDAALAETIGTRITQLTTRLEQAPKSAGWKIRASIGRRVQWYMLPEEVVR
jgi:esterase/lipase superfamily enzyme